MEIGTLLFTLAMVVFVLAYVLRPLAGSARGVDSNSGRRLSDLQAERDRILDSILEIDMDHAMGKVPDEDYHRLRQILAREGAEILSKIDERQILSRGSEPETLVNSQTQGDMELEAAIAQLRSGSSKDAPQLRSGASEPEGGACPECGEVILPEDRYCAKCGAALEEPVT